MSNNLKRQVIHHLAEQGIPANYDPWNAVKMRLEGIKVSPKTMRQPRIDALWTFKLNKHFIGAMLFILSVAIVFFLTPQGQVTAKNLFELFRKGDSNIGSVGRPVGKGSMLLSAIRKSSKRFLSVTCP